MVLAVRTVHLAGTRNQVRPARCAHQDKRRTRSPRPTAVCGVLQTRSVYLGKSVSAVMSLLWQTKTVQLAPAPQIHTMRQDLPEGTLCSVSAIYARRHA